MFAGWQARQVGWDLKPVGLKRSRAENAEEAHAARPAQYEVRTEYFPLGGPRPCLQPGFCTPPPFRMWWMLRDIERLAPHWRRQNNRERRGGRSDLGNTRHISSSWTRLQAAVN